MFQSLSTKIKQFLFDKSRCFASERDGVVEEKKEALSYYKNQLVIPRSKAVYKTISVESIKKADLQAYIANQVIGLSPFESSGFYVRFRNSIAMLWLWDSEYELEQLAKFNLSYSDTDIFPETVLYSKDNDVSLISCRLGGYEGQIWRNGILIGSRYWAKKPSEHQLAAFVRTFSFDINHSVNMLSPSDFSILPWYEKQWSFLVEREFAEKAVPNFLSCLLFLFLGWQAARLAVLSGIYSLKESELESKQVAVETTLDSRQKALTLNQQTTTLNSKVDQPQMALLYGFVNKLTDDVADIRAWRFREGELRVEIALVDKDSLDVASLVSNLEDLEYVSSVSVRRLGNVGNRWEIQAEISL